MTWLEDFVDQQEGLLCIQLSIEEACSLIDDNSWANLFRLIRQETSPLCWRPPASSDTRRISRASLTDISSLHHPLVRIYKTLNSEPKEVSYPCWALLALLRTNTRAKERRACLAHYWEEFLSNIGIDHEKNERKENRLRDPSIHVKRRNRRPLLDH
ncbi:hypothetical protein OUZ56_000697 [Daphnia magna]|uniref:Uncharacterized protein n=1 Tax=Daphnia magna TaxID=35525 RepID=A0ABR0A0H1_9CRUS|nr:hypothetical protein OUZ56_000697 [Daphnia magna]